MVQKGKRVLKMPLQPESTNKLIEEAIKLYNAKRYNECLSICEKAIQLDPICARAYHGKGLALAQLLRIEQALCAYQEASHIAPENAKIYVDMAEILFIKHDYEKSGLAYKKAIQFNSRFEAVYAEKTKSITQWAFNMLARALESHYLDTYSAAISIFREALLFNPNDTTPLTEIEKIEKEMEGLRDYQILDDTTPLTEVEKEVEGSEDYQISDDTTVLADTEKKEKEAVGPRDYQISYKGSLLFSYNRASIYLSSVQSDEKVRIFFLKKVKDGSSHIYEELSFNYFSKTVEGWSISFTFPLPEMDFRIEVLRNELVIANGYYRIKNGYFERDAENHIFLTIAYKPARSSRREESYKRNSSSSTIYVSDRTGGRNRRVRRGS